MSRRSPLYDLLPGPGAARPLAEMPLQAHITVRGNAGDGRFSSAMHAATGLNPPVVANTFARSGERTLVWMGPDEWLLQAPEDERESLLAALRAALAGQHAAVVDTSDGLTTLMLEDPRATEYLSRGCPLDLDESAFRVGTCAQSLFGKSGVLLLREGPQRFALTVRRSFARYFLHALQDAIALDA